MNHLSIYQKIKNSFEVNPTMPYQFQNVYEAGKRDIVSAFWENRISYLEQEAKAYRLIEEIKKCMDLGGITESFSHYVNTEPIYHYLTKFSAVLQDHLEEDVLDSGQLYRFGLQLAAKSSEVEEVKVGMLILGMYETDLAKDLVRVLGFHSEFTLYALEASNSYQNRNEFIFELAKNTRGYGKMAAVQMLQPITKEQKQWILEEGGDNEVIPNISCVMCLCKAGLSSYFKEVVIDEDMFSCLSYLFAYAFAKDSIARYPNCEVLVRRYLDAAKEYAEDILDLSALCIIEANEADYECKEVLNWTKWEQLILNEMKSGNIEITEFLGTILTVLDLEPDFVEFEPLLEKMPFDLDILKFLLEQHPKKYWKDIYQYLQEKIPIEVLEGQKIASFDDVLSVEFEPDLWLYFLLFALRQIGIFQERLVLSALNARYQPVREEALMALKQHINQCESDVKSYLKAAKETEPSEKLKKEIEEIQKQIEGERHEV